MITKGEVSLDVEDNLGAHDWPHLTDLALEDVEFSVHLPLVPQTGRWPTGNGDSIPISKQRVEPAPDEVVRVLNIVVPETRLLASRERCPFLIHVEVADSGLAGHDARLYAAGASPLGSTVEEALGLKTNGQHQRQRIESMPGQIPYEIPPELLEEQQTPKKAKIALEPSDAGNDLNVGQKVHFPRGGWQADGQYYPDAGYGSYSSGDPYEEVRQQEYEQLHQQMQTAPPVPVHHSPFDYFRGR